MNGLILKGFELINKKTLCIILVVFSIIDSLFLLNDYCISRISSNYFSKFFYALTYIDNQKSKKVAFVKNIFLRLLSNRRIKAHKTCMGKNKLIRAVNRKGILQRPNETRG